jgi:hypothetical protein
LNRNLHRTKIPTARRQQRNTKTKTLHTWQVGVRRANDIIRVIPTSRLELQPAPHKNIDGMATTAHMAGHRAQRNQRCCPHYP